MSVNKSTGYHGVVDVENNLELNKNIPNYSSTTNQKIEKYVMLDPDNELVLNKNTPIPHYF